jgi:hypothetical protein
LISDNYFALFKALKVENKTQDTMTTQCMSPGRYCLNVWMNGPSSGTRCNIMLHTAERDRNIGILNKTTGWTELAFPFSATSNFEVI